MLRPLSLRPPPPDLSSSVSNLTLWPRGSLAPRSLDLEDILTLFRGSAFSEDPEKDNHMFKHKRKSCKDSPFLYFANVDHMTLMPGVLSLDRCGACLLSLITWCLVVTGTALWLLAWGTTTKWIFRALLTQLRARTHARSTHTGLLPRKRNTLKQGSLALSVLNKDATSSCGVRCLALFTAH